MPIIVVGADTPVGREIVPRLGSGEVRVFVRARPEADRFPTTIKVAVGDVSDGSHVGDAAIGAFGAVLIGSSAVDDRERSFADDPAAVFAQWADGLSDAGVTRVIFVGSAADEPRLGLLTGCAPEFAFVTTDGRSPAEIAGEVADLERARTPPGR